MESMKPYTENDWNRILVKASGLALVTVSLTWLPQVFAACAKLAVTMFQPETARGEGKIGEMMQAFQLQMTTTAIGEIVAFVVLVALARWIFSFPTILQKWLQHEPLDTETPDARQPDPGDGDKPLD